MAAPHPTDRIQAVRRLASQGLSDREVGDRLGITKTSVGKIRRRNDIPAGKPIAMAPEILEAMRQLARQGAGDAEIGRAVGMNRSAVHAARKRHGIEAGSPPVYHQHGTLSMYNSGCRCDDCRAIQSQRNRAHRTRMKERFEAGVVEIKHGLGGYTNWGCRCEVCRQAGSRANKEYYKNGAKQLREKGAAYREAHREQLSEKSKVWRDGNREHVRATNSQRFRDYQRKTIDRAAKHYQQWTSAELEVISRADISVEEMALLLGRTWNAVQKQRQKMRDAERGKEAREGRSPTVRTHGLGGYGRGCRCEICAEAKRRYRKAHGEKVQAETVQRAGNARKQWTGPELELAARNDLSVKEIARRLGRSYAAVSVIRHRIRHDPKTSNFAGLACGVGDEGAHPVRPDGGSGT